MTFMPPGEHLDGTTAERAHLYLLLACFRASPPPMRLPEVTGHPLPEVLGSGIIDPSDAHRSIESLHCLGAAVALHRDGGRRGLDLFNLVPPLAAGRQAAAELHQRVPEPLLVNGNYSGLEVASWNRLPSGSANTVRRIGGR